MDEDESRREVSKEEMNQFLHERVEKKEEQILKIEASVFQVANYNFVFQGVILTAIIKGSSSAAKCQRFWWVPLCLSAIGAALNLGTLVMIARKYKVSLDELDDRRSSLSKDTRVSDRNKAWRRRLMLLYMLFFSFFVLFNLFAAWVIPCPW